MICESNGEFIANRFLKGSLGQTYGSFIIHDESGTVRVRGDLACLLVHRSEGHMWGITHTNLWVQYPKIYLKGGTGARPSL